MTTRSDVYDLADAYVERFAALDPLTATGEGITGHDHEMTDYSPDGVEERAEHDRATLRALRATAITSDAVEQQHTIAGTVESVGVRQREGDRRCAGEGRQSDHR